MHIHGPFSRATDSESAFNKISRRPVYNKLELRQGEVKGMRPGMELQDPQVCTSSGAESSPKG